MNVLFLKLKNFIRKKFRIVRNDWHCPESFHPLLYRIEQRYTLLFFIHWWGIPTFAPPHLFESPNSAAKAIKDKYPNAIIYDYYSDNKRKV